eukprot:14836339-Heterocapsa_arctica.AAC.1
MHVSEELRRTNDAIQSRKRDSSGISKRKFRKTFVRSATSGNTWCARKGSGVFFNMQDHICHPLRRLLSMIELGMQKALPPHLQGPRPAAALDKHPPPAVALAKANHLPRYHT